MVKQIETSRDIWKEISTKAGHMSYATSLVLANAILSLNPQDGELFFIDADGIVYSKNALPEDIWALCLVGYNQEGIYILSEKIKRETLHNFEVSFGLFQAEISFVGAVKLYDIEDASLNVFIDWTVRKIFTNYSVNTNSYVSSGEKFYYDSYSQLHEWIQETGAQYMIWADYVNESWDDTYKPLHQLEWFKRLQETFYVVASFDDYLIGINMGPDSQGYPSNCDEVYGFQVFYDSYAYEDKYFTEEEMMEIYIESAKRVKNCYEGIVRSQ